MWRLPNPERLGQRAGLLHVLGVAGLTPMDWMDLLADPAYRHVLLNHIPVIGLMIAWLVLATGLLLRQTPLLFTGLTLIAITAGISVPVANYGDAAYPAIYDILDGHSRDWLDYHAEVADTWLPLLYATSAFAITAIIISWARLRWLPWVSLATALLTLVAIGGVSVVASAGGKIQHPEFRISDPP